MCCRSAAIVSSSRIPDMQLERVVHGTVEVLKLQGRLDADAVGELEIALRAEGGPLIVDLQGLSYLSSAGIRCLIEAEEQHRNALALSGVRPELRDVLKQAGVAEQLALHDDLESALRDPRFADHGLAAAAARLLGASEGSRLASDELARSLAAAAGQILKDPVDAPPAQTAAMPASGNTPTPQSPRKAARAKPSSEDVTAERSTTVKRPALPVAKPKPESTGVVGKIRSWFKRD